MRPSCSCEAQQDGRRASWGRGLGILTDVTPNFRDFRDELTGQLTGLRGQTAHEVGDGEARSSRLLEPRRRRVAKGHQLSVDHSFVTMREAPGYNTYTAARPGVMQCTLRVHMVQASAEGAEEDKDEDRGAEPRLFSWCCCCPLASLALGSGEPGRRAAAGCSPSARITAGGGAAGGLCASRCNAAHATSRSLVALSGLSPPAQ